ncbi:MAG: TIGR00159 family protein [Ruminococcaceae bacterium]|nr:TIGR00159 family protein [Oscillospiraceae bacterium]
MGNWFTDLFRDITGKLGVLFGEIKITDLLDVLIIAFIIYEIIILVRNTRASQIVKGVVLLLVVYIIAELANLRTLSFVLQAITSFGIVVLAIVFQPELRRAIEQVGQVNSALSRFLKPPTMEETLRGDWQKAIVAVCDAAERMAEERTGALIAIERRTNLNEIIRTGTALHSDVNVEMLGTIFYEGTPLHDGAVVVREAKIEAAGCFLPLSNNLEISRDMGTRHRSALGLSENSDAVVVVVSEESGIISLAKNGVMIRRLDRQNLFSLLVSEVIPPEAPKRRNPFRRKTKVTAHEEKE